MEAFDSGTGVPLQAEARPAKTPWAIAGVLALALAGLAAWTWWPRPKPVEVGAVHFTVAPPEGTTLTSNSHLPRKSPSPPTAATLPLSPTKTSAAQLYGSGRWARSPRKSSTGPKERASRSGRPTRRPSLSLPTASSSESLSPAALH